MWCVCLGNGYLNWYSCTCMHSIKGFFDTIHFMFWETVSNLNLVFPNCVRLIANELQKFSCFCFPTTANTLQLWPFKWVLGFNTSLHDCWVIILPTKPFSRSNSVILSKVNSLLIILMLIN